MFVFVFTEKVREAQKELRGSERGKFMVYNR